jgi:hypothetical protein
MAKAIYQILDMNGLFQGEAVFIFFMAYTKMLAPAWTIE